MARFVFRAELLRPGPHFFSRRRLDIAILCFGQACCSCGCLLTSAYAYVKLRGKFSE
jgi:hypothetical protein